MCNSSFYQIENLNYGHMNKISQWQSVTVQAEQVYHCYLCTWWQWKSGILNCLVLSSWWLFCLHICLFFCAEINCPCVAGWQQRLWERRPEKWDVSISGTHYLIQYIFLFPSFPSSSWPFFSLLISGPSSNDTKGSWDYWHNDQPRYWKHWKTLIILLQWAG